VTHLSAAPQPGFLLTRGQAPAEQRAEADLRVGGAAAAAGLVVGWRSGAANGSANPPNRDTYAVAWLDASAGALVTDVVVGGRSDGRHATRLPESFTYSTWHNVAVETRAGQLTVRVTGGRQEDPIAVAHRTLPTAFDPAGSTGVAAMRGLVGAANVGASPLFRPGPAIAPLAVGAVDPAYSDEFDGSAVPGTTAGSPWHWVRGPYGSMADGNFVAPTEGDLWADSNNAPVLLRPAPSGDYTVETKLTFDGNTPFQQAGLVAYVNDDEWIRLTDGVKPSEDGGAVRHETEFAHEDDWRQHCTCWMDAGPTAQTMWLRLVHRVDPASGLPTWQAETSRDGVNWVKGGTWWLPRGADPAIGLAAMNTPGATARFDYFRVSRP